MKLITIVDLTGIVVNVAEVADDLTGVFPIYETLQPTEENETPEPILVGYQVAISPPVLYKHKFDVKAWESGEYESLSDLWVEGLTQTQLDEIKNQVIPIPIETKVKQNGEIATILNERTKGLQDIDSYTLDMTMILEDRTQGMKDIDDYTLNLLFQQADLIEQMKAQIDDLTQRLNTLEGVI